MEMRRSDQARSRILAVCTFCAVAVIYAFDLGRPALFDEPNDAQYAEVAREMVVGGDWISPQLNGVVFLNKPPLLYWLIAACYTMFGINEAAARVPGIAALLLILVLLYRLAEELFDTPTAFASAALLAAMPATFVEARFVRPDLLVTASIVATLLGFVLAFHADERGRRRAFYAMQAALACGLLAKGMIALLLPLIPIVIVVAVTRRWDLLRAGIHPRSWILFLALIAPWHVLAAWRHEGFAWDYIVNQHLLFFLDRKEPRDSIPLPLPLFWVAVIVRLFPWTWTVIVAVVFTIRRLIDDPRRIGWLVPMLWAAVTLLFFSLTVSRLEHYAIPALPALALLCAATLRTAGESGNAWRAATIGIHLVTVATLLGTAWWLPRFLGTDEWLRGAPDIVRIPGPFFGILAGAWLVATVFAVRVPNLAIALTCTACLATTPMLRVGMNAFAPINSSAPVAAAVAAAATPETHIVFAAPTEYQLVAGLNFYLGRSVTLLRPPAFVEPPYLLPYRDALFIDQDRLDTLWRTADVILVSDPLAPAERSLTQIAPAPASVIARIGNRWIIRNRAADAG